MSNEYIRIANSGANIKKMLDRGGIVDDLSGTSADNLLEGKDVFTAGTGNNIAGDHSLGGGENNTILSRNSLSVGYENFVGLNAYYISSIDMENKKIYLTKTQPTIPSLTEHSIDASILEDEIFYEVGDAFSIISEFHYPLCGIIKEIDENRTITYENDLPFTTVYEDSGIDGNTFYVTGKPSIGCVMIRSHGYGLGYGNIIAGSYALGAGLYNIVHSNYGMALGMYNEVGYGAAAINVRNRAYGDHSFAFGQRNYIPYGAKNSVAGGFYTIASSPNQFVFGQFNEEDKEGKYTVIIGNGTGEAAALRHNSFTLDRNGNAWFSGKITIGEEKYQIASKIETVFGRSNTPQGENTMVFGQTNNAFGKEDILIGIGNQATPERTTLIGFSNKATGTAGYSMAVGFGNQVSHGQAYLFGKQLVSSEYEQIILGKNNVADTNAVFIIGNGTNAANRSNAMIIRKTNNNVEFAGSSIKKAGKELATEEYVSERMDLVLGTGAPETLNSIAELAAAMNNDPNFKEALATKEYVNDRMSDINVESYWDYNEENNSIIFGNSLLNPESGFISGENAFSVGYGCMPTTANSQSFGCYTSIGVKGYKTTDIAYWSNQDGIQIGYSIKVNTLIDNDPNTACSTVIANGVKVYALTYQEGVWQLLEVGNIDSIYDNFIDIISIESCPDLTNTTAITPMLFLETPRKTELQPRCLGDVMAQGPDVMYLTPEQVTGLRKQDIKISSAVTGHTEGWFTYIGGNYAHAQNNRCRAIGNSSDAGGQETWARGGASMTRGGYTQTMPGAIFSFARGKDTICHRAYTEASGLGNEAYREAATVRGTYATLDTAQKYLDMVGNGTSPTNRKNIYTLSTEGILWVPKEMRVGGTSQDDEDAQTIATKDDINAILLEIINTQKEIVGGEL